MSKRLLATMAALCLSSSAIAAPVTSYPAASALTGGEGLYANQNGHYVQVSLQQLATYIATYVGCSGGGSGALTAVPSGSTNGTALGTMPAGACGARLYLGTADSVTFTIASSPPNSPPSQTFTVSGAVGGTGPNWDENLINNEMMYVTAKSGSPEYRWY